MPRGAAITIAKAWELGKIWYRDRLDPDWEPKTVETMRAIFLALELEGEFWTLG